MKRLLLSVALLAGPAAAAEPHPDATRVLSLGGSITEIVYALGEEGRLVGRDMTSSFPPEAQALPDVGYVRQLSPEGVLSVKPDLILAEDGAGPPETVEVLKNAGIAYESIASDWSDTGIRDKIDAVATALGVPEKGQALADKIAQEFSTAETRAKSVTEPRKVMFIMSLQGGRIMASGRQTSANGIIHLAGAQNAFYEFEGYKTVTDEAVLAANPDVILMMDRNAPQANKAANGTDDHAALREQVLAMPAIAATPAGKNGAFVQMDGLFLLGFGPRTGQAALALHDAVYGTE
ncbi:heme/hemin ABC transporter substrate-binding protein [Paracoccus sulfuroxidans]|uniref:Iron complex transport system substrate-binding protein n=1 Tax=Paracoccus sulfuroxidans TaxID=384678 RepID=A0A562NSY7_9RHOB|nr:ABC transporter substrate-binding protein [Paracoccus sulfuroxidans]TWI35181.1 iron complex transport system substrate-binding protein [Paracoccus sulfuroxidans]